MGTVTVTGVPPGAGIDTVVATISGASVVSELLGATPEFSIPKFPSSRTAYWFEGRAAKPSDPAAAAAAAAHARWWR
jgi:hypothetical protein